ncbi:aminotransferase [Phreatobacter oligotrophus]|jgi:4-aminobutyrate---pyruvate transaminase|uniref:4-aminobutyrate--pyruvate transaminase n=1 Tax=Phreatobacter oligotrophus TaxID=1122261 RepID=A0A2T4ZGR8_9HYPH|nr:aminotransferase [Phreatobacter oligotrophus]MBX9991870.1 aminotransferase class III-fold pyridoxal phosphate-dependent enzyme [Phreatobacter oligotrophus]PTM61100.1 4-aminobutyrate--pyruvate transaminase [Phreatobacter oligotrophus]
MALTNLQVRDLETVLHPYTNQATIRDTGTLVLERAKGIHVYDVDGKPYIEGMAGLWCTSLGYGNEELADAAYAQMKKLSFTHLFGGKSHDPAIELAERLKEKAPVPISKVFFVCSGSEANDSQIKMIWYMNNAMGRPQKKKIVSRIKGYHGVTIASASLTGLPANHTDFDLPISGILHTSCPHHYRFGLEGESEEDFATRCAQDLEDLILREGPDTVAAFIAEPVMGAGGVIVPPKGYFEKMMAVCQRYDVFMIADEVICAFGRLGEWFGSSALGYKPNSISIAKALTSAYMPVGAILIPEEMYQATIVESKKVGTFGHGFTYSGHPVGAAVALKTLEIYDREKIIEKAAAKSPQFQAHLKALGDHPLVGEARGLGMMGALEMVADKRTKKAFEPKAGIGAKAVAIAQEEGVILRNLGDALALCPPLIISPEEIDDLFDRVARTLDRVLDHAKAEGLLAA